MPSTLRLFVCCIMAGFLAGGSGCAPNEQHRQGIELADSGDYDQAVTSLREASQADPGNDRYKIDLAETEMTAAEKHLTAAEKLVAENQATPAREEVRIAEGYAPAHPKALKMSAELDQRVQQARELARQSSEALAGEQWADALILALEASRLDAGDAGVQSALSKAQDAAKANRVSVTPTPTPVEATRAPAPPPDERPSQERRAAKAPRPAKSERRREVRPVPPPEVVAPQPALPPGGTFRGTLSRDDDRYPKKMAALDGIVVKLEDTDHDPLNADITISVGRYKLTRKHIRVGMPVYGRGASGRSYRLIVEAILPKSETIHFLLEAVSPSRFQEPR